MGSSFFILCCARSGSTSLARILDTATNATCAVEPTPNLNRETRDMIEGRIQDPRAVINATVVPRVQENLEEHEVYGEKSVTYGPFIPYLYDALECKFVLLKRDGRDVVRSLVDWHEQKFGTVYRECKNAGDLSGIAVQNAANLPTHLDTCDYSRPRPRKDSPLYYEWESFSREEMCAYYWARIYQLYVEQLKRLPEDAWMELDYTRVTPEDVQRVASFCGLKGLSRLRIQEMLLERINSLGDRDGIENQYPDWKNWDGGQRCRFDRIAAGTMRLLGYYGQKGTEWRPVDYGQFWRDHDGGLDWYTWMFDGRREMHRSLVAWVRQRDQEGDTIESIADFGCGLGVGYCEDFADKRYFGIDISQQNVLWCRRNRKNSSHEYRCSDFVGEPLPKPVDLVFSSGTLDNVYDIDAALKTMVNSSRKWIRVTFYRGWFPDLNEHQYSWSKEHGCFYSDVSPRRIREVLTESGCTDIQIEPIRTGRSDIAFETLVVARTSKSKPQVKDDDA